MLRRLTTMRCDWFLMSPTQATLTALAPCKSTSDVLPAGANRDLTFLLLTIDLDVDPPRWQRA